MEIVSYNSNYQNFKGLDVTRVFNKDKKFILANLSKLQELGQHYDIEMRSLYSTDANYSFIDISVKHLKEKMSFIQRFFAPVGLGSFAAHINDVDNSIMTTTIEAISRLNQMG